jgi:hypothetical protein
MIARQARGDGICIDDALDRRLAVCRRGASAGALPLAPLDGETFCGARRIQVGFSRAGWAGYARVTRRLTAACPR